MLKFQLAIKCENHAASILILKEIFNENELAEDISFGKKTESPVYASVVLSSEKLKYHL